MPLGPCRFFLISLLIFCYADQLIGRLFTSTKLSHENILQFIQSLTITRTLFSWTAIGAFEGSQFSKEKSQRTIIRKDDRK